jgi:hypothetical protein
MAMTGDQKAAKRAASRIASPSPAAHRTNPKNFAAPEYYTAVESFLVQPTTPDDIAVTTEEFSQVDEYGDTIAYEDVTTDNIKPQHYNWLRDAFANVQQNILRGVSPGGDLANAERLAQLRKAESLREFGLDVAGMRTSYESDLRFYPRAIESAQNHIMENQNRQRVTGEDRSYNIGLWQQRIVEMQAQEAQTRQSLQDFDRYAEQVRRDITRVADQTLQHIPNIVRGDKYTQGRSTSDISRAIREAGSVAQALRAGTVDRQELVSMGVSNTDITEIITKNKAYEAELTSKRAALGMPSTASVSEINAEIVRRRDAYQKALTTLREKDLIVSESQDGVTAKLSEASVRGFSQELKDIGYTDSDITIAKEATAQMGQYRRDLQQHQSEQYQAVANLKAAGIEVIETPLIGPYLGDRPTQLSISSADIAEAAVRGFRSELQTIGYTPEAVGEAVTSVREQAQYNREYREEVSTRLEAIREFQRLAPHVVVGSGGVDLAVAHIEGLDRLSLQAGYSLGDIDRATQNRRDQIQTQADAASRLSQWLSPAGLDVLSAVENGVDRDTFVDYGLMPDIYDAAKKAVDEHEFPWQRQKAFYGALEHLQPTPPENVERGWGVGESISMALGLVTNINPVVRDMGDTTHQKITTPITAGFAEVFPGAKPEDYSERLFEIREAFFSGRLSLTEATEETRLLLSEVNPATRITADIAANFVLFAPLGGVGAGAKAAAKAGDPLTGIFGPRLIGPSARATQFSGIRTPGLGSGGGLPGLTRSSGGVQTIPKAETFPIAGTRAQPQVPPFRQGSVMRIGQQGQVTIEPPLQMGRAVTAGDVPKVQGLSLDEAVGVVKNLTPGQQALFLRGLDRSIAADVIPYTTMGSAMPIAQRQAFLQALDQGYSVILKPDGTLLAVEAPVREPDLAPVDPDIVPDREPWDDPDFNPYDPSTYTPSKEPEVMPDIEPIIEPTTEPDVLPAEEPIKEPATPAEPWIEPKPLEPAVSPYEIPAEEPLAPTTADPWATPEPTPVEAPTTTPDPFVDPVPTEEPWLTPEPQPATPPKPSVKPWEQPKTTTTPFLDPSPATEPIQQPAIQPNTQPDTWWKPQPMPRPANKPWTQPEPAPVAQPVRQPMPSNVTQPAPKIQPAPMPSPWTQPSPQPQPSSITQPTPMPQPQPALQQPIPRPIPPVAPPAPPAPKIPAVPVVPAPVSNDAETVAPTVQIKVAGINRGFLDTAVDFQTGEVQTFKDSPVIPDGPTKDSFTPLSYSDRAGRMQRIPWGALDLIIGPGGTFKYVKQGEAMPEPWELRKTTVEKKTRTKDNLRSKPMRKRRPS